MKKPGRPKEGRVKLTVRVLPATAKEIRGLAAFKGWTIGRIIDGKFSLAKIRERW